jgi:hypothetical protein
LVDPARLRRVLGEERTWARCASSTVARLASSVVELAAHASHDREGDRDHRNRLSTHSGAHPLREDGIS